MIINGTNKINFDDTLKLNKLLTSKLDITELSSNRNLNRFKLKVDSKVGTPVVETLVLLWKNFGLYAGNKEYSSKSSNQSISRLGTLIKNEGFIYDVYESVVNDYLAPESKENLEKGEHGKGSGKRGDYTGTSHFGGVESMTDPTDFGGFGGFEMKPKIYFYDGLLYSDVEITLEDVKAALLCFCKKHPAQIELRKLADAKCPNIFTTVDYAFLDLVDFTFSSVPNLIKMMGFEFVTDVESMEKEGHIVGMNKEGVSVYLRDGNELKMLEFDDYVRFVQQMRD